MRPVKLNKLLESSDEDLDKRLELLKKSLSSKIAIPIASTKDANSTKI